MRQIRRARRVWTQKCLRSFNVFSKQPPMETSAQTQAFSSTHTLTQSYQFSSAQFSCSVVSSSLRPHGAQCPMFSSNCCFMTCIQISQEAGQVVWYSHLFQNFPQFIVIHTVKGFVIVNKAEIDVFLELSCFFNDPADVGNLISGCFAFSKSILNM